MRIAILHHAVTNANAPDESDVIVQAQTVGAALTALGHTWASLPCTLNLNQVRSWVEGFRPDVIFNLVESLEGTGRLIHLVPTLIDTMGVAYTGSCAEAIMATSHKVIAKGHLVAMGLPTPPWIGPFPSDLPPASAHPPANSDPSARWLVKSVWEHASIGIDEKAVVLCNHADCVSDVLRKQAAQFGGACFAETFIDGREFNLSLLAGPNSPEVLKPAEILFEGYPPECLRIVGYRAKWEPSSYEYQHTPRRYEFPAADAQILAHLQELAIQCWQGFGLNGYARVDFRVDSAGKPWILEINTNPCLSPDAGFTAALQATGISYTEAIARILADTRWEHLSQTSHGAQPGPAVSPSPRFPQHRLPLFRYEACFEDSAQVLRLAEATGLFNAEEVAVAEELVHERLSKGAESGYHFVFAEDNGRLLGYTCYGPIPLTASSYDLYWIAVSPDYQRKGIGRLLLDETVRRVRQAGGDRLYADTSGRQQYENSRAFYERMGFHREALLADFYAEGDAKVIYSKKL